ncbi:MAG: hypothetical protein RL757_2324 [Bacteroidota bacterium]|jgi:hypothetical protein
MDAVFKKMNFKSPKTTVILNSPESFDVNIATISDFTTLTKNVNGVENIDFAVIFATKQAEVDEVATIFASLLVADGLLWIAYPKGTSKRYQCEFNRDTGWAKLGESGFEPVRQVAIDEDWSALRFRRVEFIKTMTRSFAMTEKGKEKTEKTEKIKK